MARRSRPAVGPARGHQSVGRARRGGVGSRRVGVVRVPSGGVIEVGVRVRRRRQDTAEQGTLTARTAARPEDSPPQVRPAVFRHPAPQHHPATHLPTSAADQSDRIYLFTQVSVEHKDIHC